VIEPASQVPPKPSCLEGNAGEAAFVEFRQKGIPKKFMFDLAQAMMQFYIPQLVHVLKIDSSTGTWGVDDIPKERVDEILSTFENHKIATPGKKKPLIMGSISTMPMKKRRTDGAP
jgi:hypothetical protein